MSVHDVDLIEIKQQSFLAGSGIPVTVDFGCQSNSSDSGFWLTIEFQCHSISSDNGIWVTVVFGSHKHPSSVICFQLIHNVI